MSIVTSKGLLDLGTSEKKLTILPIRINPREMRRGKGD